MERAEKGKHPADKKDRASAAEQWLLSHGVTIGSHPKYGRADLVATKSGGPTYIVEVEGDSSRQKEQALYSALGQTILQMHSEQGLRYGLALPDTPQWEAQIRKIPVRVKDLLDLTLWLVGRDGVRAI